MDQQAILQVVPGLIVVVIIAAIVYRYFAVGMKRHKQALTKLTESGFSIDHLMKGSIHVAWDVKAKKIAFLGGDGFKVYPYSDVLGMKWDHIDNISKHGHHTREQNKIVFTLADPENPVMKVSIPTEGMAEHWAGKVQAIMH